MRRGGGRATACFKVWCMRSWRPFCWGLPGAIRCGRMPSLIHHSARRDSPPTPRLANGGPWVGADRPRHPVGAKGAVKERIGMLPIGALHGATGQQEAAALIADRQRLAAAAIAGTKPSLEIRTPDVVGSRPGRPGAARGGGAADPAARRHQAVAREQRADGARGRPRHVRLFTRHPGPQFARPPARVRVARLHHLLGQGRRHLVRVVLRRPRALPDTVQPVRLVARQHFVAGRPANAVRPPQLAHGPLALEIRGNEL